MTVHNETHVMRELRNYLKNMSLAYIVVSLVDLNLQSNNSVFIVDGSYLIVVRNNIKTNQKVIAKKSVILFAIYSRLSDQNKRLR